MKSIYSSEAEGHFMTTQASLSERNPYAPAQAVRSTSSRSGAVVGIIIVLVSLLVTGAIVYLIEGRTSEEFVVAKDKAHSAGESVQWISEATTVARWQ